MAPSLIAVGRDGFPACLNGYSQPSAELVVLLRRRAVASTLPSSKMICLDMVSLPHDCGVSDVVLNSQNSSPALAEEHVC